ncbi:Vacuolar membrane-associated protein IML1, partial [Clarias magur]
GYQRERGVLHQRRRTAVTLQSSQDHVPLGPLQRLIRRLRAQPQWLQVSFR